MDVVHVNNTREKKKEEKKKRRRRRRETSNLPSTTPKAANISNKRFTDSSLSFAESANKRQLLFHW